MQARCHKYPFPGLPKTPRQPCTPRQHKQGEAAAMTMIAGFRCDDGIVLCADRQITAPGYYKYQEKKILTSQGPDWKLTFAYSGLPGLAKEAREKIVQGVSRLDPRDVETETVMNIAGSVLDSMGRQYTELQLQLLVGTAGPAGDPELLKFDGKGLHIADNFNFLGVGDSSLVRFLSDVLYSEKLTVEQGTKLGAYLIRKAGQYIDGIGDDPIDVIAFSWGSEEAIPETKITAIVKEMEEKESKLADLLIGRASSNVP